MLIKFEKDGNVYKGVCLCGDVFYVLEPNDELRCKECLLKNKELKKNKLEIKDNKRLLKSIVYGICKKENDYE